MVYNWIARFRHVGLFPWLARIPEEAASTAGLRQEFFGADSYIDGSSWSHPGHELACTGRTYWLKKKVFRFWWLEVIKNESEARQIDGGVIKGESRRLNHAVWDDVLNVSECWPVVTSSSDWDLVKRVNFSCFFSREVVFSTRTRVLLDSSWNIISPSSRYPGHFASIFSHLEHPESFWSHYRTFSSSSFSLWLGLPYLFLHQSTPLTATTWPLVTHDFGA